jgi:hypothetical protein
MRTILVVVYVCMYLLAGCSTYKPTAADYDTDYRRDGIYVLQRDVYIIEEKVTMDGKALLMLNKPPVDYPRHWVKDANDPTNNSQDRSFLGVRFSDPILPTGTRIKFKKIRFESSKKIRFESSFGMGAMFEPIGVVLDGTHSGIPVSLDLISQGLSNPNYGKYVNPKYLKLISTSGD